MQKAQPTHSSRCTTAFEESCHPCCCIMAEGPLQSLWGRRESHAADPSSLGGEWGFCYSHSKRGWGHSEVWREVMGLEPQAAPCCGMPRDPDCFNPALTLLDYCFVSLDQSIQRLSCLHPQLPQSSSFLMGASGGNSGWRNLQNFLGTLSSTNMCYHDCLQYELVFWSTALLTLVYN